MSALIEWAHQGGAREQPSNTLRAMEQALDPPRPAVGLEFDVHRTCDRHLVVMHDRHLERTTNGHGRIRRHELGTLRKLNAAWWWTPGLVDDHSPGAAHPLRDEDVPVATLSEILAAARATSPPPPITIEIKGWRAAWPLVDVLHEDTEVRPCLQRLRPPKYQAGGPDITLTSFFTPILWLVRLRMRRYRKARVSLSPGTAYLLAFWLAVHLGLRPLRSRYTRLQIPIRKLVTFTTPRFIETAHRVKVTKAARQDRDQVLRVDVWTIDDPVEMVELIKLGVDGIMTDSPSVLRDVMAQASGGNG